MLPRDLPLMFAALCIASCSAAVLSLFPVAVQSWSRCVIDRRPWLRALLPACDLAALTDARRTWVLRVYGLSLVPVAALAAHAVVMALRAA